MSSIRELRQMLNNQSWHQLAGATPQAHNHVQQPQQPLPQPGAQGQPLPSWTAPSQQHQLGAQHPLAPAQQQQQQSWAATQHQQQPLNAPQQHQQWQPLPPAEEERDILPPPPPPSAPAPEPVQPAAPHEEVPPPPPPPSDPPNEAQQAGLTQEQYQAMSTEQQAAYWEQWNQYYAQYYQQGPEAQQYAAYQQPQQYQYGAPGGQYAAHSEPQQLVPEQTYHQQHLQQQQQQAVAQAAHAPPAAAAHHTGLTMTHTYASTPYDAHAGLVHLPAPGSVDFSSLGADAAVGLAGMVAVPQQKKPSVPAWLLADMLKRGLVPGMGGSQPSKQGDIAPDPSASPQPQARKFSEAAGSRWAGGEEDGADAGKQRARADSESDESDDEEGNDAALEEERRARINLEIKRHMTAILLEVTDPMFSTLASEALRESLASSRSAGNAVQPPADATADDHSASDTSAGPDLLGLGYASDDASDHEKAAEHAISAVLEASKPADAPAPEAVPATAPDDTVEFKKGDRVWYVARDGARTAATVVSVDVSHPPPFYGICMAGGAGVRETEGHRLAAMTPAELADFPDDHSEEQAAQAPPGAGHQQAPEPASSAPASAPPLSADADGGGPVETAEEPGSPAVEEPAAARREAASEVHYAANKTLAASGGDAKETSPGEPQVLDPPHRALSPPRLGNGLAMEGSALPSIGTLPDATAEAQQPAADHLAVGQPADEQAASTAKRKHAEETSESGDTRKAKRSKGKASRAKEEKKEDDLAAREAKNKSEGGASERSNQDEKQHKVRKSEKDRGRKAEQDQEATRDRGEDDDRERGKASKDRGTDKDKIKSKDKRRSPSPRRSHRRSRSRSRHRSRSPRRRRPSSTPPRHRRRSSTRPRHRRRSPTPPRRRRQSSTPPRRRRRSSTPPRRRRRSSTPPRRRPRSRSSTAPRRRRSPSPDRGSGTPPRKKDAASGKRKASENKGSKTSRQDSRKSK